MSELNEQLKMIVTRLDELRNDPSELTRDLVLTELRGFYDVVKRIELKPVKPIRPAEPPVAKVEPPVVKAQKPVAVIEELPNVEQKAPVQSVKIDRPVEEPTVESPVPAAMDVAPLPEPAVNERNEQVAEKPEPAAPVVARPIEPRKDAKAAHVDQDKNILAGKLNRAPVSDLGTAIPLNEKFGIIRTLFKGNASDYADAVLRLNRSENPNEMRDYMAQLSTRFAWDEESETYEAFSGYVERKMLSLSASNPNAN